MATNFSCDTEVVARTAQELEHVHSAMSSAGDWSRGGLDGVGGEEIHAALSRFDEVVSRSRQEITDALRQAANRFTALVDGEFRLDQELAAKTPTDK